MACKQATSFGNIAILTIKQLALTLFDTNTTKPIYQQIMDQIILNIENGRLTINDALPSINTLAQSKNISRDTVMMAYNELKQMGVIKAIPGKGYYVKSTSTQLNKHLFLLFDELNAFKEDLYQAFINNIPDNIQVDLFFHHFNKKVFEKLIEDNKRTYHQYVIMPSNMCGTGSIIDRLPHEKVILLDQPADGTNYNYPIIYQSFYEDIYNGLEAAKKAIKKYKRLILLHPGGKEPAGFRDGFVHFCSANRIEHCVSSALSHDAIEPGCLFVCIEYRDLIDLVKQVRHNNYTIGQQIGIICINDTALLEIIEGGITAISTDFREMGRRLAQMVTHNETGQIKNPSRLIVRNSL